MQHVLYIFLYAQFPPELYKCNYYILVSLYMYMMGILVSEKVSVLKANLLGEWSVRLLRLHPGRLFNAPQIQVLLCMTDSSRHTKQT